MSDRPDPPSPHGFRRGHAAIVGVDAYASAPPLTNAVHDASVLADLLGRAHGYDVSLLCDAEATRAGLLGLLTRELPARVGADDRLLFYFAGHGVAFSDDRGPAGFVVPQDGAAAQRSSLVSMAEVHEALAALPCRHVLAIFDCCFAGAFRWASATRDLHFAEPVVYREHFERFARRRAWQALTSAAPDELALDSLFQPQARAPAGGDHSPFAAALLEGLSGAADLAPADGLVTATELYLYVRARLQDASGQQTPGLWPLQKHDGGEYLFQVPGRALDLPPAPPTTPENNPFRGLEPFEEGDAHLFFGRDELSKRLAAHIASNPFSVVVGASGTGKSSLVRAGLLPRLREDEARWSIAGVMRPGAAPELALAELLGAPDPKAPAAPGSLARRLRERCEAAPGRDHVLVIDQLEELTLALGEAAASERFLAEINAALDDCGGRLRIVATLRADIEPAFAKSPLGPRWRAARFGIPLMSRAQLREAVERPASSQALEFEPRSLVDELVDEIAQTPGALPLLSFTLRELYLKCAERGFASRAMTRDDYEALGRVVGAVTTRADRESEALERADPEQGRIVRSMMLRMIAEGGEAARRRARLDELEYGATADTARAKLALARFTDARLLVQDSDELGPYAEPAHDALVLNWTRLQQWRREHQEDLTLMRLLRHAVSEWSAHARKPAFLWHDNPRLPLLRKVARSREGWLNRSEREFVGRSVRRRRFRLARSVAAALLALTAPLGLAVVATVQSCATQSALRRAETAERETATQGHISFALRLCFASAEEVDKDPGAALLMAQTALDEDETDTSKRALQTVLDATSDVIAALPTSKPFALSADGQTLATAGVGVELGSRTPCKIELWRLTTGRGRRAGAVEMGAECPERLVLSDDGQWLAAVDSFGGVFAWRFEGPATKLTLSPPAERRVAPGALALSANGGRLAAARGEQIVVWSLADGKPLGAPLSAAEAITSLRFGPAGRTLLVGGRDGALEIIDVERRSRRARPASGGGGAVYDVRTSPDGKTLAAGFAGGAIDLFAFESLRPVGERLQTKLDRVERVAFSSAGDQLVAVGSRGGAYVVSTWDLKTRRPLGESNARSVATGSEGVELDASGSRAAFRRSLSVVVTSVVVPKTGRDTPPDQARVRRLGWNPVVRFWEPAAGRPASDALLAHADSVSAIEASPDGEMFLSSSNDGTVQRWSAASRGPLGTTFGPPQGATTGVRFSPSARTLATFGADGCVYRWDARSAAALGDPLCLGRLRGLQFLDERRVVVDRQAWDFLVASNWKLETWALGATEGDAYDGAGRMLEASFLTEPVAEPTPLLRIRHTSTKRVVGDVPVDPRGVRALGIDPEARYVAVRTAESLQIWRTAQHDWLALAAGPSPTTQLRFSDDGRQLAEGRHDGTIQLWHVEGQGAKAGPELRGHLDPITALAFAPDGALLMSGEGASDDHPPSAAARRARVCALANRNLALHEWKALGGEYRGFLNQPIEKLPDYCRACPDLESGPGGPPDAPACSKP
jgi:WD40 repeat protein